MLAYQSLLDTSFDVFSNEQNLLFKAFSDILVTPKYIRKPRQNREKVPSPEYTSPEAMEFILRKDKTENKRAAAKSARKLLADLMKEKDPE